MLFHIINKKKSLKKNNNLTLDPNMAQMLNAYGEEKANQVQN